jgi:hypothetical protein
MILSYTFEVSQLRCSDPIANPDSKFDAHEHCV